MRLSKQKTETDRPSPFSGKSWHSYRFSPHHMTLTPIKERRHNLNVSIDPLQHSRRNSVAFRQCPPALIDEFDRFGDGPQGCRLGKASPVCERFPSWGREGLKRSFAAQRKRHRISGNIRDGRKHIINRSQRWGVSVFGINDRPVLQMHISVAREHSHCQPADKLQGGGLRDSDVQCTRDIVVSRTVVLARRVDTEDLCEVLNMNTRAAFGPVEASDQQHLAIRQRRKFFRDPLKIRLFDELAGVRSLPSSLPIRFRCKGRQVIVLHRSRKRPDRGHHCLRNEYQFETNCASDIDERCGARRRGPFLDITVPGPRYPGEISHLGQMGSFSRIAQKIADFLQQFTGHFETLTAHISFD